MDVLTACRIDMPDIKAPKNLGSEDARILEMFNRLAPYYWCRTQDLPADLKLVLGINRWGSVFHALYDLSKMTCDKRLSRALSEGIKSIQSRL